MKNYICTQIILLYFIGTSLLSGQHSVNTLLNDVVMPSPAVATMGKFTEVNTSLSKGTIDITIPIHVVQSGPLSLPISLSYNTSGIKAGEISDWVGSGWNLSAGGMVARTVQGLPDDYEYGFWSTHSQLYTCTNTGAPFSIHGRTIAAGIINGWVDGEPDIFSFNLPGYNGKFYFDFIQGIKTPILIDQQDVKIEEIYDNSKPIREKLRGFKIITPDGNIFWFGEKDGRTAIDIISPEGQHHHYHSWQLIKVESSDLKYSINLEYIQDKFIYHSKATETKKFFVCLDSYLSNDEPNPTQIYNLNPTTYFYTEYSNSIGGNKISKITTVNQTINFISTQDRQDTHLNGTTLGRKLNKIEILTGTGPSILCKHFNFSYDYFKSSPSASNPNDKKLKLTSVQESSCDNLIINSPHLIEYNGTFCPNILTKAIDHWGYYNGATQNGVGAENFPLTTINFGADNCSGFPAVGTVGGANRETNESEMIKGSIKKITYPTGGFAEYTFEANEICGPLNITDNENEEYLLSKNNCEEISIISPKLNSNRFTEYGRKLIRVKVEECIHADESSQINPFFVLTLLDNDSIEIDRVEIEYESKELSRDYEINELFKSVRRNQNFYIKLSSPNEYCSEFNPNVIISAVNKIEHPKQKSNTNTKVGGLRIKKMILHDGLNSSNDIIRNYTYLDWDNSGCSSGKLLKHPKYLYIEGFSAISTYDIVGDLICGHIDPLCTPMDITKYLFQDQSVVPLTGFDGYHILYSKAQEIIGEVTFAEYEFELADPLYFDPNIYPFLSGQSLIAGGKEKKAIKSGIDVSPEITEISDKIVSSSLSSRYYYKASWDVILYSDLTCGLFINAIYGDHWRIRGYPIRSGSYKVKERKFTKNITTTEGYEYSSPNHHFPTASFSKNSDNKVFRTEYVYNTDYPNTSIKNDLIARNIISSPWKTIQKAGGNQSNGSDGSIVDGTETEYAYFNISTGNYQTSQSGGFARPYKLFRYERTWDSNNQLIGTGAQLTGTISNYDVNGKPKTYTKVGWLPETYEWTTDGQLKKRTFKNYIWQYNYIPGSFLLDNMIDIDGQITYFEYDQLFRLKKEKRRSNNVITDYTYNYKSVALPHNFIKNKITYTAVTGSLLNVVEDIQYFDGLGRSIQSITSKSSATQKDVVQISSYDPLGQVNKNYIPFEANQSNGAYVASIPINTKFEQYTYESVLNGSMLSSTPPSWYPTNYEFRENATSDQVRLDLSLTNSYYPTSSLLRKKTTDPNGNKLIEFTDKRGRLILSRKSNNTETLFTDTYYTYDDKNRLVKVIPPGIQISDANNIFSYAYDGRDNIISKNTPAKGLEKMVYNSKGLQTFHQDPLMNSQVKWMMYKYDDYGQETQSGFWNGTTPNAENTSVSYNELLKEYIYDDITPIFKGRIKQEKVKILDGSVTPNWLSHIYSYDIYGRVSNLTGNNHLNLTAGSELQTFVYDFGDNIISSTRTHKKDPGSSLIVINRSTYDHRGRDLNSYIKINSEPEKLLSSNVYNPRNWIVEQNIGGNSAGTIFLQNVNYSYNDQGWLTGINDSPTSSDVLTMQLWYDQSQYILNAPLQKNGNISHLRWKVGTGKNHYYGFNYDYLDRMLSAKYGEYVVSVLTNFDRYNENLTYDARGNVLTLNRNGEISAGNFGIIDQLTFTFLTAQKNRISNITETGNFTKGFKTTANTRSYGYDLNGNQAIDFHKNVTYSYFYGSILKRASFHNGNQIDWVYDANGKKLSRATNAATNNTKHYCNGIEYSGTGAAFTLESIAHPQGRIVPVSSTWQYEYALKDHLGNVRVTFADLNSNGSITTSEILQENHYYPFGGNIQGLSSTSQPNKYQFNGNESNEEFGLDLNDFNFRWYDPWIARFVQVDPLAQARNWISPYNFGQNNPINRIDPAGMLDDWYLSHITREVEWHDGSGNRDGFTNLGETVIGTDQDGNTMYGAQDGKWYNSAPLNEVTISARKPYKDGFAYAMVGELASGEKLGSDNPYLPYQGPDAISFQAQVSASGIFMEGGFSVGIAASREELGVYFSMNGGAGISAPGFGFSGQMNLHHSTQAGNSSLSYIDGIDAGGSVGLGLIGGYSRSVSSLNGNIRPIDGFKTYSLGVGIGAAVPLGVRTSLSRTHYEPFIEK